MSGLGYVLKVASGTEIHRVQMEGEPDLATVQRTLQLVWGAYSSEPVAKYIDDEGDLCTLVPASFGDFMDSAVPRFGDSSRKRPVLKVTLFEASLGSEVPEPADSRCHSSDEFDHISAGSASDLSDYEVLSLGELPKAEEEPLEEPDIAEQSDIMVSGTTRDVTVTKPQAIEVPSTSPSEPIIVQDYQAIATEASSAKNLSAEESVTKQELVFGVEPEADKLAEESGAMQDMSSDELEQEARALVEQARRACEDDLREHLRNWLAAKPQELSYAAWIQAVHPENAKDCIDSRMYLEASFHRQLWNSLAAGADGLSPEERERRHVPASDVAGELAGEKADASGSSQMFPLPSLEENTGRIALFLRGWMGAPKLAQEEQEHPQEVAETSTLAEPESELQVQDEQQPEMQTWKGSSEVPETFLSLSEPVVWKEEAADWLAARLPIACAKLHARMMPYSGLPEDLRPGLCLLADTLREAGPKYQTLAEAAACLTVPEPRLHRGAIEKLVASASSLSRDGRLFYARALLACCPKSLVPVLPAQLRDADPGEAQAARMAARLDWKQQHQHATDRVRARAMQAKEQVAAARDMASASVREAKSRAEEARNCALLRAAEARCCALARLQHRR